MSDFVYGVLSARGRRRVQRHAEACPECGPLQGALVRLVGEMRRLRTAVAADASIAPLVVARIRGCHDLTAHPWRSRS